MSDESTSIRIKRGTLEMLFERATEMQRERGERVSYDTVLQELLAATKRTGEKAHAHTN